MDYNFNPAVTPNKNRGFFVDFKVVSAIMFRLKYINGAVNKNEIYTFNNFPGYHPVFVFCAEFLCSLETMRSICDKKRAGFLDIGLYFIHSVSRRRNSSTFF
jgi:hypothetical protein